MDSLMIALRSPWS